MITEVFNDKVTSYVNKVLQSTQKSWDRFNKKVATEKDKKFLDSNQKLLTSNNISNILLVCLTFIYSINFSFLFSWLLNLPPLLDCTNRDYLSLLAGSLYFLLFLLIPVFCLNLFTASCDFNENHMVELLPWKPLTKVGPFSGIHFQGDTLKIQSIFYIRVCCRLIIITVYLWIVVSFLWYHLLSHYSPFSSLNIFSFFSDDEVTISYPRLYLVKALVANFTISVFT